MASTAVVNASPLIYLSRSEHFELLKSAAERIVVPDVVVAELSAHGAENPALLRLHGASWIEIVTSPAIPGNVLDWQLGPGESAVLAWALENPGCLAIVDDLAGRRCAETVGVSLRGTLGLVLRARRAGSIASARQVLEDLRTAGMYLSDRVLNRALALIGE